MRGVLGQPGQETRQGNTGGIFPVKHFKPFAPDTT